MWLYHVRTKMHTHIHPHICTHSLRNTHTHTQTNKHTYTHTHTYIYIYIYIYGGKHKCACAFTPKYPVISTNAASDIFTFSFILLFCSLSISYILPLNAIFDLPLWNHHSLWTFGISARWLPAKSFRSCSLRVLFPFPPSFPPFRHKYFTIITQKKKTNIKNNTAVKESEELKSIGLVR